jgi:hypothetical protein|tara:strand:- start:611 stop:790 length:180 start_codon:yes stop_codon:yes gene_type:complete
MTKYIIESSRNRRIIVESEDKEGIIRTCRDLNEIDAQKTLGVNNFVVTQNSEIIYGETD